MRADALRMRVHDLMPEVLQDLEDLIRFPSVSFPGFPRAPVDAMAAATADLLRRYGLEHVQLIDIPGSYPAVYGDTPAPEGVPVVLCYAHYDVQPARAEGWDTDPWTPHYHKGRIFGRGSADDKSGIVTIAASVRLLAKDSRVRVKVFIEGGEEGGSDLSAYIEANPGLFACDLFLINDMGTLAAGEPAISVSCRGEAACTVTVSTLQQTVHSGTFGGAAPDALMALIRMLAALIDEDGSTAVPGLASIPVQEERYPPASFRETAGVLEGVDLIGRGSVSGRLWCSPSVNVIGIDAPPTAGASNALIPKVAAVVSLRIAPDADPEHELAVLTDFLRSRTPWHVQCEVRPLRASPGFVCPRDGPLFARACQSLQIAYGRPARLIGSGGTIPLLHALQWAAPEAEFVLWGCEDQACSHIHGENESVSTGEVERMILAQSILLTAIGNEGKRTHKST